MRIFLFVLACLFSFTLVFSVDNLSELKIINEENKKIEKDLQPLREDMITLKGQIKYLDDLFNSKQTIRDILWRKIDLLKEELIKKTKQNHELSLEEEVNKKEINRIILELWRNKQYYQLLWQWSAIKSSFYNWFDNFLLNINLLEKVEQASRFAFFSFDNDKLLQDEKIEWVQALKADISSIDIDYKNIQKEIYEIKNSKEALLAYSQGKEEYFKNLIKENKKRMLESLIAIRDDSKQIWVFEKKLDDKVQEIKSTSDFDPYDISKFWNIDDDTVIWPVNSKIITAKFMDLKYRELFWIDHTWIDIKIDQWAPVKAVLNSYVYKVVDWWMDYSYVILLHKWDLQTVYWHLSELSVKEWQIVLKGDTIGLSGWMPGTKWAWVLTTGPHLHFEVHKNKDLINPLEYLNL